MTLEKAKAAQLRATQALEELYQCVWANDGEVKTLSKRLTAERDANRDAENNNILLQRISKLEEVKGDLETELKKHKEFGVLKDAAKIKVEHQWFETQRREQVLKERIANLEKQTYSSGWKTKADQLAVEVRELTAQNTTQTQTYDSVAKENTRLTREVARLKRIESKVVALAREVDTW